MISEDLKDELEAIEAIYPECITRLNDTLIDLKIPQHEEFKVRISFLEQYPESDKPHILQVRSKGQDSQYLKTLFIKVMDSVYLEGAVCLFNFLAEVEDILYMEATEKVSEEVSDFQEIKPVQVDTLDGWTISDPIIDRGSTFIAFVREVHSEQEAYEKLKLLKSDKKISKASHNMVAFRIQNDNGTRVSDCDDDGETAAGGRMLHLITIMNIWNVIVVVSRWFGGTHIGPDRFKHINSTARNAIVKAGFLNDINLKTTKNI